MVYSSPHKTIASRSTSMTSLSAELVTLLGDDAPPKEELKRVSRQTKNEIIDEIWYTKDKTNKYRDFLIRRNFYFYVKYRTMIDSVPDQRNISKETRSKLTVKPWNPWKALAKEFDTLDTIKNEDHIRIYNMLDNNRKNEYTGDNFIKDFLKYNTNSRQILIEFFATYPTLGYILGILRKNIAFALIGENENIAYYVAESYLVDDLLILIRYVNSRHILDIVLKNVDVEEYMPDYALTYNNMALASWIIDNTDDEEILDHSSLIILILRHDEVELYKKLIKVEIDMESIYSIIDHDAVKIFQYVVPENEYSKYVLNAIRDTSKKILELMLIKNKVERYTQHKGKRIDIYQELVDGSHIYYLNIINLLIKYDVDIENPIKYGSTVLSLLLYALEEFYSSDIDYIMSKYEFNNDDLLYSCCGIGLYRAVPFLLEKYEYSTETLQKASLIASKKVNLRGVSNHLTIISQLNKKLPDIEYKLIYKKKTA